MNVDYAKAIAVPSPNFGGLGGPCPKRYVVIHETGGGASGLGVARDFQNATEQKSTHYVVEDDEKGTVYQCVREAETAWGNGIFEAGHAPFWRPGVNPNVDTISIEHFNPNRQNARALGPAQKRSGFALILDICNRHHIPKRPADAQGGVMGHNLIQPINRHDCPGHLYPWHELYAFLNGGGNMLPGWHDDGTTLTAPNGVPVRAGFRAHILSTNWDPGNIPLEAEYTASRVLLHNTAVGTGQVQMFRDCQLWYTVQLGVHQEPYIGWELDSAYKEIARLQALPPALPAPIDPAEKAAIDQALAALHPFE